MKENIEMRTFNAEIRAVGGDKPKITGYACVFNQLSDDLGGFREIIDPGPFGNTINDDVFALINHDANFVLGRNKSGTLSLFEDNVGLGFEIDPPNTTFANDLLVSMERGDINKCSFAFIVADAVWETLNGEDIRRITKFKQLFDISLVVYPAFPQTSAEVNGKNITTPEQVYAEYRSSNQLNQENILAEKRKAEKLLKEKRDRDIDIMSIYSR